MSERIDDKFGYYAALLTAIVTAVTLIIAMATPPISGPFCRGDCVEYPYTDILSRFPRDYIWMFPAILMLLLYVGLMVSIHRHAEDGKKPFSLCGVCFAVISAAVLIANYFLQLSVIQPSLARGETAGISLLTQYNPHGVFIALEEVGCLLMSLSFLFAAPVFSKAKGLERSIRRVLFGGFILTIASLIAISIFFGINREYFFEVAAIAINWIVLIVIGILLSRLYRRRRVKELKVKELMG